MTDPGLKVRWAPKAPRKKIRRLCHLDAMGALDEALLDDVGLRLALRCQSVLMGGEGSRSVGPVSYCAQFSTCRPGTR